MHTHEHLYDIVIKNIYISVKQEKIVFRGHKSL
jgi:hypothetical protein